MQLNGGSDLGNGNYQKYILPVDTNIENYYTLSNYVLRVKRFRRKCL